MSKARATQAKTKSVPMETKLASSPKSKTRASAAEVHPVTQVASPGTPAAFSSAREAGRSLSLPRTRSKRACPRTVTRAAVTRPLRAPKLTKREEVASRAADSFCPTVRAEGEEEEEEEEEVEIIP